MTDEERMRAFEMRIDGESWEAIGEAIGYDKSVVWRDLHSVMENPPRRARIIYPAIAAYIAEHHAGSIEAFASSLGVSAPRLRGVIVHGERPSERMKEKVSAAIGLRKEEAFNVHLQ